MEPKGTFQDIVDHINQAPDQMEMDLVRVAPEVEWTTSCPECKEETKFILTKPGELRRPKNLAPTINCFNCGCDITQLVEDEYKKGK